MKPGKYQVILRYACDKGRQGSDCVFATQSNTIKFVTQSKHRQWQPDVHDIGVIEIKEGDSLFRMKCSKMKADWIMDFYDVEFVEQ